MAWHSIFNLAGFSLSNVVGVTGSSSNTATESGAPSVVIARDGDALVVEGDGPEAIVDGILLMDLPAEIGGKPVRVRFEQVDVRQTQAAFVDPGDAYFGVFACEFNEDLGQWFSTDQARLGASFLFGSDDGKSAVTTEIEDIGGDQFIRRLTAIDTGDGVLVDMENQATLFPANASLALLFAVVPQGAD